MEIDCQKGIVDTGIEYNGETQIKSGIQAGDRIITVGYNEFGGWTTNHHKSFESPF